MTSTFRIQTEAESFVFATEDKDWFGLRKSAKPGASLALQTDRPEVVAAALVGLQGWANEVHLLPPGMDPAALPPGVIQVEPIADEPVTDQHNPAELDSAWVVYTSGTTGVPKPIRHTQDTLTRTISSRQPQDPLTWGLLYDPNRMAGLQVLHHALASGATVVAPTASDSLADRVRFLAASGVTALSATPTLWRMILQVRMTQQWDLRQITLGGEIADQRILDSLARRFPDARIVHIFASTETGAAFSVTDGLAGFPASYLDNAPRGVRLEVRDDILHIHSPGVSTAGKDGFASTGDVVEVTDQRVFFRGRESGVVNVGGANVWPEEVEQLLREHPEVLEAQVSATPNAMTGFLLIASVVATEDAQTEDLGKRLRSWVRKTAPGPQVPAKVRVVDALEVMPTGKAAR